MDGLISLGLGLLAFVSALCLAGLARAMRNDKLPPNMWAGIRTKAALESESSWYQVQRAGSVPVICLATAYADSGLLFILQGIYHETISILIPVIVFSVQSLVGIIQGELYLQSITKTRVEPASSPRLCAAYGDDADPPAGSTAPLTGSTPSPLVSFQRVSSANRYCLPPRYRLPV